jgi:ankyrin repeat protein
MRQRRFFLGLMIVTAFFAAYQIRVFCQPNEGSALVQAVRRGDLAEARRMIQSGVALNAFDMQGTTPLIEAIRDRFSDFAQELVSAGADPNFVAGKGADTPLMVAAWYCDSDVARFLLEHGATVNARNSEGETALTSASQTCLNGEMIKLLLDAGADVNSRMKRGDTPLMIAAFYGNVAGIKILLPAGSNPNAKNLDGETASSIACGRRVGRKKTHDEACALLRR